jgi:hypothetical protein
MTGSPEVMTTQFLDATMSEVEFPLEQVAGYRFEDAAPVRSFPSYRGQRNWPGWWWSATTGGHVGYESWLERDVAMMLDFDHDVVAIAAQPFRLTFRTDGKDCVHVPDYFVRHVDGSATVVDCRAADGRRPRAAGDRADLTDAAEAAVTAVGWSYRRMGRVPEPFGANLRWLAGYRHPRFGIGPVMPRLEEVFAAPLGLAQGVQRCGSPIAVLPVLFHMLWHGHLSTELHTAVLDEMSTVVQVAAGASARDGLGEGRGGG